jgi:hypothetical protein
MHTKLKYTTKNSIILITIFNFLFPLLGLILNSVYYFINNLSLQYKKIIFFNIAFSFSFLGFLYLRTNETGDVYRYALSLYYYGKSMLNGREHIIEGIYESFYPLWYFILYVANKLNLNIQFINMIAGFTIYFSWFYIILDLERKYRKNVDKILIAKILLYISFIAIFSSYKTLWAYSFIFVGIYMLLNNKKLGYIYILFGIGIHPIAWIPLIIYLISNLIKFKKIYLYISIILGMIFKNFIQFFTAFLNIPFIGSKINTYIYGQWSLYRFQDNSEYVKFFILVCLIIFVLYIILFNKIMIKSNDKFFRQYNNFILFYFSISLWFISFRTIELRLMEDGIIFFLPLFYQAFMIRRVYKKYFSNLLILFIWWVMIDFRIFNFFNKAYIIGDGFPLNIFSSSIIYTLKDVL